MGTKRWLAAIGGAVLVAAVGVGAVMAQSDEESGRLSFLDRVAQKLGIERDTLDPMPNAAPAESGPPYVSSERGDVAS